ncbi:MAG: hypothetical protein MI746_12670 [Pseudomonadales bacterium]|nr:hypothetical protein [Pseudomonadales bacterium]
MSAALQVFGIMMGVFLPIGMIVFISEYFKYKRSTNAQIGDLKKELEENSTAEMEKEIASLKERIMVLETIVTDRGFELEHKISNL